MNVGFGVGNWGLGLDICNEKIAMRCNSHRDLVGKSEVMDNLGHISVDWRVKLNDS
jgi:hypothetical protein